MNIIYFLSSLNYIDTSAVIYVFGIFIAPQNVHYLNYPPTKPLIQIY